MNLWVGEHVGVREVEKRKPVRRIAYGIFRPEGTLYWLLDLFEDKEEAIFVAKYIDEHGGSYESAARKAAKRAWREKVI